MLGLIAAGVAIHIVPNVIMKAIKMSHKGHEVLTATFAAGVKLGLEGKKVDYKISDLATYGFGPESMVEYMLGHKLGTKIANFFTTAEAQESFIEGFKAELNKTKAEMTEEEVKDLNNAPIVNSLFGYAEGNYNTTVFNKMVTTGVDADAKRSIKDKAVVGIITGIATAIESHLLMQPIICAIRKVVGTSKLGKKIIKGNFRKGFAGMMMGKIKRAFVDVAVAPSALDPMRLGNFLNKSSNPVLNQMIQEMI